jgi:hypothetical protein
MARRSGKIMVNIYEILRESATTHLQYGNIQEALTIAYQLSISNRDQTLVLQKIAEASLKKGISEMPK